MRFVLAALLTLVSPGVAGAGAAAPPSCSTEPVTDVAYMTIDAVNPRLLSLDIAPVAGDCSASVAVWVHGGGWQSGDKRNGQRDRAAFYNAQGWVLVSVNYRLSASGSIPPVRYPDFNDDVAAALAWVRRHVAEHGGDPTRLLVVGHSAGAGISAAVMTDPRHLARHGLDASMVGCLILLDTEGYDVAAVAADSELYRDAFGDDPAGWAEASPVAHVGDGPLPGRALIVTQGPPRRVRAARTFAEQLAAHGVDVSVADVSPLTHSQINILIGSGDDVMTPLIAGELARCA